MTIKVITTHAMKPVIFELPGRGTDPSKDASSWASSNSTAKYLHEKDAKGCEGVILRSSTLQSSSWAPLGRPRAIDNRRSNEYTHHHTRRRISLLSADILDLLEDRLRRGSQRDEMGSCPPYMQPKILRSSYGLSGIQPALRESY